MTIGKLDSTYLTYDDARKRLLELTAQNKEVIINKVNGKIQPYFEVRTL